MKRVDRIRYYLGAADSCLEAIRLQRERCLEKAVWEHKARIDLSFFVIAVQQLRAVACQVRDRLKMDSVRPPLQRFDKRWPRLKEIRNSIEHCNGPEGNGPAGIWYFRGHVDDCKPDGSVEILADARHMEPSIDKLYQGLRKALKDALNESPGSP